MLPLLDKYRIEIYTLGLFCIAVGLSLSRFLMSAGQIILVVVWILDVQIWHKLRTIGSNKVLLSIFGLFLIHILGLLYTNDYDYALHDIKTKIPLLSIPLTLATDNRALKHIRLILIVFLGALVVSTFVSIGVMCGFGTSEVENIRSISIFISHIRFGLLLSIGVMICCFFIVSDRSVQNYKWFFLGCLIWFIIFLFILSSISGILILFLTFILVSVKYLVDNNRYLRLSYLVSIIFILGIGSGYLFFGSASPFKSGVEALSVQKIGKSRNLYERVNTIVWEVNNYLDGGQYEGHSVVQRLEYWRTALEIVKDNPILGVGTGDIKFAFERKYVELDSRLSMKWRLRGHNQYLTVLATFGIIGFGVFFVSLIYPLVYSPKLNTYLYLSFFSIMIISMITEDTLETQAGATMFAFFNSLFLFSENFELPDSSGKVDSVIYT